MKQTALYSWHESAGARIIDFGGYLMPVQYSGIIDEHRVTRTSAGLFDVSHMGNFYVRGTNAAEFLQYLTTNDLEDLSDGQAQYTLMLYAEGGVVDDLIVYRLNKESFFLIVNAGNAAKDYAWMEQHIGSFEGVRLEDHTDRLSLLALQGPRSGEILRAAFPEEDFSTLPSFHFRTVSYRGYEIMVARTGYTGESGVEISVPNAAALDLWSSLVRHGERYGLRPVGLGARDTLRLEMGYSLYGHEIDSTVNPLEARLKWVVRLEKGPFIGREACRRVELAPKSTVAGFSLEGRVLPRQHCRVFNSDRQEIGLVCSGTLSPTLQEPIGTCSLPREYGRPGTAVFVEVREVLQPGVVRSLPFIRRSKV